MDIMEEMGYALCVTCHGECLAFSLDANGECYWCSGSLQVETDEDGRKRWVERQS
jgi:hypothetical protein